MSLDNFIPRDVVAVAAHQPLRPIASLATLRRCER